MYGVYILKLYALDKGLSVTCEGVVYYASIKFDTLSAVE